MRERKAGGILGDKGRDAGASYLAALKEDN
jgi:hypothetical protein